MSNKRPDDIFSTYTMLDKVRDWMYDRVYQEGDFALQFVGDLIRGSEPQRAEAHLNRQLKYQEGKNAQPEQTLTKKEQQIFVELLKRRPTENQILYWKRKKALLNSKNKRDLINQHLDLQSKAAKKNGADIQADHKPIISPKPRQAKLSSKKAQRR